LPQHVPVGTSKAFEQNHRWIPSLLLPTLLHRGNSNCIANVRANTRKVMSALDFGVWRKHMTRSTRTFRNPSWHPSASLHQQPSGELGRPFRLDLGKNRSGRFGFHMAKNFQSGLIRHPLSRSAPDVLFRHHASSVAVQRGDQ